MAEARTQAITGKVQPRALVIGRTTSTARTREQRIEQFARERDVPFLARTQHVFKLCAQPARVLRRHVCGLAAERALDQLDRLVEPRMPCGRPIVALNRRIAAQLEFEPPAARRVVGCDAMHFERADFGQRRGELHRRFACVAARLRIDDRRDRRQPHEIAAVEVDEIAGLILRLGHRRHEVETHRLSELQRERAIVEPDLAALFRTARQQADAARGRIGRTVIEHEEIAARGAAADTRRMPGACEPVRNCAARDGHIRMRVVQHVERCAAPRAERLRETARERACAEHAAVEQQRVGQRTFRMTVQERGDVPRDGRVARIRQPEFDDRRAHGAAARRLRPAERTRRRRSARLPRASARPNARRRRACCPRRAA